MRRVLIVSSLVLGLSLVAPTSHAEPAAAADKAGDKASAKDRILGALELPRKAHALRKAGVDEPSVKAGLKAARDKKLHARDAAELLDAAGKAVKDHGPVDNFGAFVQTQLDAGLRGKDLADAIRKEHESRGKGKDGKGKAGDKGKPDEKGADAASPDAADVDAKGPDGLDAKGPPDAKGNDAKGPDGKGPDDKVKPEGADAADPDAKGNDAKGNGDKAKPEGADAADPKDGGKAKPDAKAKQPPKPR